MDIRLSAVVIGALTASVLAACLSAEPGSQPGGDGASASATPTIVIPERYTLQQSLDFTIMLTTTSIGGTFARLDRKHSCERGDTSPQLAWEGVPEGAASLALVVEDPASDVLGFSVDVLWAHWIVYSIPPGLTELAPGQVAGEILENGARQGANDFKNVQYNGPCPIPRLTFPHTIPRTTRQAVDAATEGRQIKPEDRPYYFRLYALDVPVDLSSGADRDTLLQAIDGHILAAGELAIDYKSVNSRYCYPTTDPEVCLGQVRR